MSEPFVRIVCSSPCTEDCAAFSACPRKNYREVRLVAVAPHPTTPCCGAPWVPAILGPWKCSSCGKEFKRAEVLGR